MARRPSCSAASRVLYALLVLMALTTPSITAHAGHDDSAPALPHHESPAPQQQQQQQQRVEVSSSSSEVVLLVEDEDTDEFKALQLQLQLQQAPSTPPPPPLPSVPLPKPKAVPPPKLPPKVISEHSVEDGSRMEDHSSVYAWPIIIGVGVVGGIALLTLLLGHVLNKAYGTGRGGERERGKGKEAAGSKGKEGKRLVPGQGISTRPTFSSP